MEIKATESVRGSEVWKNKSGVEIFGYAKYGHHGETSFTDPISALPILYEIVVSMSIADTKWKKSWNLLPSVISEHIYLMITRR